MLYNYLHYLLFLLPSELHEQREMGGSIINGAALQKKLPTYPIWNQASRSSQGWKKGRLKAFCGAQI